MRKYNISSLYVVEVQHSNDNHYLICKKNKLSATYVEIFTNEKVEITDNVSIEPLANYYNNPLLKPLRLDKKELLRKYTIINAETSLEQGKMISQSANNIVEINSILERATLDFFPKEGKWGSRSYENSNNLEMENLPYHLSDDLWLARMLKRNQKLFFINTRDVLQFVKTSQIFQEKKHDYEQEIVKWQIEWMISGGEGWIVDDKYGGEFVFLTPVCDLGFRKGVVDTLLGIGMSLDAIEEGIEKNATMWRDMFMNRAFENEYRSIFLSIDFSKYFDRNEQQDDGLKNLKIRDAEFKEKWLKMRKYEYYQRHKDSVDKYGVVEADMVLSDEEVAELKIYLEQKHVEKMSQIEQFKKIVKKL